MTRRAPTTRPSYRRALQWIVDNDDTDWLDGDQNDDTPLSVSASLVADLFGHSDEKVERDLRKMLKKAQGR
jgi:hypothetical protein